MIKIIYDADKEKITIEYSDKFDKLHPQTRMDIIQDCISNLAHKFNEIDEVYE